MGKPKYLIATCGVRYWEDGEVNGVEDVDGSLIPFRLGDAWRISIDLDTGVIEGWPESVTASVHYKVCDDGRYTLADVERRELCSVEGYVPDMLSPGGSGYGDYVIMEIDGQGQIQNWRADLSYFDGGERE